MTANSHIHATYKLFEKNLQDILQDYPELQAKWFVENDKLIHE